MHVGETEDAKEIAVFARIFRVPHFIQVLKTSGEKAMHLVKSAHLDVVFRQNAERHVSDEPIVTISNVDEPNHDWYVPSLDV